VKRAIEARLLSGSELYREVILDKLSHARESAWISTANLKDMHVEGVSVTKVFASLAARGVELRVLHAELPSRPFRASFEKQRRLQQSMELKICPRVHFKAVIVDAAWVYLGSANLTGAGLGAKAEGRRNFELGFPTEQRMVMEHLSSRANREFLEALLKEISGREWALKFSLKENLPAKTPAAKSKNAPAIVREALEMFKGEIKT